MIYEPVTEFGKKIASLLKYDDGVRLDIHDYLEEVELGLEETFKKAEKWDKLETQLPSEKLLQKMVGYRDNEKKLEAVREIQGELDEWRGLKYQYQADPHDVLIQINDRLERILGGSHFTTDSELTSDMEDDSE